MGAFQKAAIWIGKPPLCYSEWKVHGNLLDKKLYCLWIKNYCSKYHCCWTTEKSKNCNISSCLKWKLHHLLCSLLHKSCKQERIKWSQQPNKCGVKQPGHLWCWHLRAPIAKCKKLSCVHCYASKKAVKIATPIKCGVGWGIHALSGIWSRGHLKIHTMCCLYTYACSI